MIRRWRDAEAMSMLRSRVGVAVMKSRLYAIGGYNGTERLNTVEEFDAGSWVTNTRGVPFPHFLIWGNNNNKNKNKWVFKKKKKEKKRKKRKEKTHNQEGMQSVVFFGVFPAIPSSCLAENLSYIFAGLAQF